MTPNKTSQTSAPVIRPKRGINIANPFGNIDKILLLCLSIYLVIGVAIYRYYIYNIGPDEVAYFSIAKLYLNGHISLAINSHWSPLFSWLLVPLLYLKLNPETAAHLLVLPVGIVVIAATWELGKRLGLSLKYRRFAIGVALPSVIFWAMTSVPDFIALAVFLVYLSLILRKDFGESIKLSLIAGAVGGLGYFSKSYCFPFFMVTFPCIIIWNGITLKRSIARQFSCFALGMAVFIAISLPWIIAISSKYNHPMIGTAGTTTLQFNAPQHFDLTTGLGLVPPPHQYSITHWEDPAKIPVKNWNPLESKSSIVFYLRLIYNNFLKTLDMVGGFSALSMGLICLAGVIELTTTSRSQSTFKPVLRLIVLLAIYSAGYMLIFVTSRYLLPVAVGSILLGCMAIEWIGTSTRLNTHGATALKVIYMVSFCIQPIMMLGWLVNYGKQYYTASLTTGYLSGQRIASNEWLFGLKVAYYQNAKFYGIPSPGSDAAAFSSSLKKNGINYFLLWGQESVPSYLDGFQRVDDGTNVILRVFRSPY